MARVGGVAGDASPLARPRSDFRGRVCGSTGPGQGRQSTGEGGPARAHRTTRLLVGTTSLVKDYMRDFESDYETKLEEVQGKLADLEKDIANARSVAANAIAKASNAQSVAANAIAKAANAQSVAANAIAKAANAESVAATAIAKADRVLQALEAQNERLSLLERKAGLEASAYVISELQKILINFYDDPTTKYAVERVDDIPSVDCRRFNEVMDQILRSGQDPPANVLEAIRARLKAAGSDFTDPLEFLKLVDENWEELMNDINSSMHENNYMRAIGAYLLFSDAPGEDWSAAS